ncbi:MAG TPA: SHOCT domain-containing protein [Gaiellaceae bacterium]
MSAEPTVTAAETPAARAAHAARWRMITARVLVVLSSLTAVIALFAGYVRFQALDTNTFSNTANQLIGNATIRQQLALTLVNQLYQNVDVAGGIREALPPRQQRLAGPIAGGLRELLNRESVRLLDQPAVQRAWVIAVTNAQRQLVRLLEDRGLLVRTTGGNVYLDLHSLLVSLGKQSAIAANIADRLPPGAARIQIVSSDQLSAAQKITRWLKAIGSFAWIIPFLLAAAAIWLATGRRRQTLRAVAIGAIVAGLLVLIARAVAGAYITNHLVKTESVRPAAKDSWHIITQLLADGAWTLIFVALVALLGVWLAGPTRSGTAARRSVAAPIARPEIAFGVAALFILLIVWWAPVPQARRWYLVLTAIVILGLGVEVLRRQTAREFPEQTAGELSWSLGHAQGWFAGRRDRQQAESGHLDDLEQLGRLRQSGVVDDEEFAAEKARILGTAEPPASVPGP